MTRIKWIKCKTSILFVTINAYRPSFTKRMLDKKHISSSSRRGLITPGWTSLLHLQGVGSELIFSPSNNQKEKWFGNLWRYDASNRRTLSETKRENRDNVEMRFDMKNQTRGHRKVPFSLFSMLYFLSGPVSKTGWRVEVFSCRPRKLYSSTNFVTCRSSSNQQTDPFRKSSTLLRECFSQLPREFLTLCCQSHSWARRLLVVGNDLYLTKGFIFVSIHTYTWDYPTLKLTLRKQSDSFLIEKLLKHFRTAQSLNLPHIKRCTRIIKMFYASPRFNICRILLTCVWPSSA